MDLIAICIATHRRPRGLERLLAGLNRQELEPLGDRQVRIVVIDNAADGSARAIVEAFRPGSRFPLVYQIEPRRGECFARNRAVEAAGDASQLAFIDDDEEPDPRWLAALYQAHRRAGAEIVCGAVQRILPVDSPPEIAPYFRRAPKLGEVDLDRLVLTGGAGNLLVAAEVFRALGAAPFPEEAPLVGGTDREFLLQACMRGYRLVGAVDAVVCEPVSPERARRRYILVRSFTSGQVHMQRMRRYGSTARRPLILLLKAFAGVAVWSGVGLVCCWDRQRAFDAIVRTAIHSGRIAGFLQVPPVQRYRITDGS